MEYIDISLASMEVNNSEKTSSKIVSHLLIINFT